MKLEQLTGLATIALLAMTAAASAGTFTANNYCGTGCDITVITSGSDYTPPSPLPFTPLDLGTSASTGFVSAATIDTPGGGISSISFASGTTPGSGLYAGQRCGCRLVAVRRPY